MTVPEDDGLDVDGEGTDVGPSALCHEARIEMRRRAPRDVKGRWIHAHHEGTGLARWASHRPHPVQLPERESADLRTVDVDCLDHVRTVGHFR